ncbi:polysaccharide pyruvyl transferase family protein [uncultured Bacteroides sp.]|uniref:polysaccharide pyruvyl transferase family protein n=1 Tax=uncultured Bacteroides sp. TaxID=162156 RepID=UPI0025E4BF56|nr:polysaccharide pyruvyl transferase family protein [uncultured Bacteroides sp.]
MKIYTLTYNFPDGDNYGQILQCFALIRFLRNLGHEAYWLQYTQSSWCKTIIWNQLLRYLKVIVHPHRIYQKIQDIKVTNHQIDYCKKHDRRFRDFNRQYIPCSLKKYNTTELLLTPPSADAFICGSDQIWANYDPGYFLAFVPHSSKRIAYAPSTGGRKTTKENKRLMQKALEAFDFVSCREQSGVNLCKELGRMDAKVVNDPTFLLSDIDYRSLSSKKIEEGQRPYIMLYLLGSEIDIKVNSIIEFAKSNGYDLKYVASQGRYDEYSKIDATIEEWIELIDKAEYVITNSFHGTVFSMIFNKPFLTIPLVGKLSATNVRIYDVLNKFQLSSRIFEGDLSKLYSPIDFNYFNEIVAKDRLSTINLFNSILV